ncbi:DNA-3-methyladenine glycosylase [Synergistales bacterium]|nr:DNA-3-methyladenine glycosylase [Synergistales bacterium]GHV55963.1 DNA-3-methyladenine glycosylase [Synergistales bacterium]
MYIDTYRTLQRDFYLSDAIAAARGLLGAILVRDSDCGMTSGRIVETEAYMGREDAACHSYKRELGGKPHRTDVMFGPGGYAYVYLIYGMYNCFNVVANAEDEPEAVLIRAVEPIDGIPLMASRRKTDGPMTAKNIKTLCSGPGKLCAAFGITREHYGADLCGGRLFIARGDAPADGDIAATPRINVSYAGEASLYPYRFIIKNSPYLSVRRTGDRRRPPLPKQ